ncbi:MAG TPA: BlaI/MecI/CopY family transcriptional regulator [Clostridiales bacterium]|nr:BlaI/MecI/CopY family transcriptional regulator [Clostridiales bacterium]
MNDISLTNAEYRFASIVWDNEPIASPELCKLCEQQLGWKRTTTYTVLKRLCDRGVMQNQATIVTALVPRDQVQQYTSRSIVENRFNDNLPQFIATFLQGRQISASEAEQIKSLIDSHKER